MENTKTVKALKKQLVAAIAMVLVAAVALGSSTYAWFVSNNKVTGTTTTISAQSNSAYLVIDSKETSTSSKAVVALKGDNVALYPATIDKSETNDAVWSSAYAETTGAATMKSGTKFQIDDGTAAKAAKAGYAKLNTFYIGTGGYDGEFTNLKIDGLEVTVPTTTENKNLGNALRILAVNRATNAWQVWSAAGEQLYSGTAKNEALAASVIKGTDVIIDVYLYYDGDDANVYSDNLGKISADAGNNGVTITFSATPKEYKVSSGN